MCLSAQNKMKPASEKKNIEKLSSAGIRKTLLASYGALQRDGGCQ